MKEKKKRARNNGGPTCDVKLGEQGKNCHKILIFQQFITKKCRSAYKKPMKYNVFE